MMSIYLEGMQTDSISTCENVDKIELLVESFVVEFPIPFETNTPLLQESTSIMLEDTAEINGIVANDSHCVVEMVDSQLVDYHVTSAFGIPSESCNRLDEPRIANTPLLLASPDESSIIMRGETTEVTVVNDNHCTAETVDSPPVDHVTIELEKPYNKSFSSSEGPQLDGDVADTSAGSPDSLAIVGRTIAPYPEDLPRSAFHFLHMRMAVKLQSESDQTDRTVSGPAIAAEKEQPSVSIESEPECAPQKRVESREWDLFVQKPPIGVWKRIRNWLETLFWFICCSGQGERRRQ